MHHQRDTGMLGVQAVDQSILALNSNLTTSSRFIVVLEFLKAAFTLAEAASALSSVTWPHGSQDKQFTHPFRSLAFGVALVALSAILEFLQVPIYASALPTLPLFSSSTEVVDQQVGRCLLIHHWGLRFKGSEEALDLVLGSSSILLGDWTRDQSLCCHLPFNRMDDVVFVEPT